MTILKTEPLQHPENSIKDNLLVYRKLFAVSILIVIIDQITKYWIHHLSDLPLHLYPPNGGLVIIPGIFNIIFTVNKGAAWGILSDYSFLLTSMAFIALGLIFFFRNQIRLSQPIKQVCFGLLIGGIIGNLIDRLIYSYVIDFLDVHFKNYHWPTFNIADSAICVGTGIYMILSFFEKEEEK